MSALVRSLSSSTVVSKIEGLSIPREKLIGTHDGNFHCDEALAVSMLKLLPEYSDATILRTRNPELLKQCGIVVDVGAVYDHANKRYELRGERYVIYTFSS